MMESTQLLISRLSYWAVPRRIRNRLGESSAPKVRRLGALCQKNPGGQPWLLCFNGQSKGVRIPLVPGVARPEFDTPKP